MSIFAVKRCRLALKACLMLLAVLLALPAFAEKQDEAEAEAVNTKIDGEFFTCEIPNAKDWEVKDGKGRTKHLVSLKYELSTTVTILERPEGEDLNSAAEKLADKLDATLMKTYHQLEAEEAAARKELEKARTEAASAQEAEKKEAAKTAVAEGEKKVLAIVKDRETLKRKADDEKNIWEYRTLVDSQTVYGQLFVSDAGLTHIYVIGNEYSTDVLSFFRTLELKK